MPSEKWRAIMPVAWRVYQHISREPGAVRIEELVRELHMSKAALWRALAELEEHGFIAMREDA